MRNKMLIYIVWVFVLALGVQSCNNDPMPNAPKEQRPISFDNIATRADLTDLQANGFGVWAVVDNDLVVDLVLMNNQKVEYKEYNNTLGWHYDPVQYWIDNSTFTFLATYPYDDSGTYFSYNTENKAVELKVSETPSQIDFLVATNETDTSEDYNPIVNLQFEHVLTSVGMNIWRDGAKHQNDQMRIRKVTLSNIRKAGTYSSTTDMWAPTNEKLAMVYENNTLADSDNIGGASKKDDSYVFGGVASVPFNELMLLPQTIDASNNIALKIEYELKRQNAADWEAAELETVLPATTWDPGKKYTYNVVLSQVTDITVYYIQTKVDPWGTPQVGGTVIIK